MAFITAVLLAVAITAAQAQTPPSASFCTTSEEEQAFCLDALPLLTETAPQVAWACSPVNGSSAGPASVADGTCDMVITGSAGIYDAVEEYNLQAVVAEDRGRGDAATYYSVAIVPAAVCTPEITFESFRGQSMCSTGYGRTAGWQMPVGYMASAGLFGSPLPTATEISADAQAMAGFFSDICAVGNTSLGPVTAGPNQTASWPERFCGACQDPATCTRNDLYYDYSGVYRGVAEGGCAVGFTRQDIIAQYSIGGEEAQDWAPDSNNFRLLCPQGGCAEVDQYEACTIAKVPARAVLVAANYPDVPALQQAFVALGSSDAFQAAVLNSTANPEDYLVQASTASFIPITTDTATYLGGAGTAIRELRTLTGNASA